MQIRHVLSWQGSPDQVEKWRGVCWLRHDEQQRNADKRDCLSHGASG